MTIPGRGTVRGYAGVFADSFADLIFASRYVGLLGAVPGDNPRLKYGLTVGAGLAVELPVGDYRAPKIPSPGKNIFIKIPSIAFTYLTGPNLSIADGTEISARLFYDILNRNSSSRVQSGNLFDIDWAITQRACNWQFGAAGAYAQQVNADRSGSGIAVPPRGNYYSRLSFGAMAAYDAPGLGGTFRLKALFPAWVTDSYSTTVIALSYAGGLL